MYFDIELVETYGWPTALRGLRRPMNKAPNGNSLPGEDDLRLIGNLKERGDDHAKILRMVGAGFTIRAPRYWWLEFSTYRVGVESISESTMHLRLSNWFNTTDFEDCDITIAELDELNHRRRVADKEGHDRLKRKIPEGLLQTRDIVANYQALRHIYHGRRLHRLPHWRKFCEWIEGLPYAKEAII